MADVNIAPVVPPFLTGFSARSVLFSTGTGLAEDNANFYYDDNSNTLFVANVTAGGFSPTPPIMPGGGGTGITSYVRGDLLMATSAANLTRLAAGAANALLFSNGPGAVLGYTVTPTVTRLTATTDVVIGANAATGGTLRLPWVSTIAVMNALGTANLNLISSGTGYIVVGEPSIPVQVNSGFIVLGSVTSALGVALKANGTIVQVRAADDSGFAHLQGLTVYADQYFWLRDGITAPATAPGAALIYVDSADGDLKIKFGDGVTKTIVVDT